MKIRRHLLETENKVLFSAHKGPLTEDSPSFKPRSRSYRFSYLPILWRDTGTRGRQKVGEWTERSYTTCLQTSDSQISPARTVWVYETRQPSVPNSDNFTSLSLDFRHQVPGPHRPPWFTVYRFYHTSVFEITNNYFVLLIFFSLPVLFLIFCSTSHLFSQSVFWRMNFFPCCIHNLSYRQKVRWVPPKFR